MSQSFLPSYKNSFKRDLLAGVFLLGLLYLARCLAFSKFNSHYIGGSTHDAGLYIWLMKHNWRDLWELPWFDTRAFYPYGNALAWSDNFILPSLLAKPLLLLGLSETFAYNSILLAAQLLNGFISYKLLIRFGANTINSIGGGAAIMLLGVLTWNLGHPQLQFIFFIPLSILFFLNFLDKRNFISGFFSGFCIFLCFISTVYYAIFSCLLIGVLLVATILQRPKAIKPKELLHYVLGVCLGLLPLIPFALPYLPVREVFGARKLYEPYYFSADFLSYFSASPRNRLYSAWAKFSHAEAYLFAGFTLLIALGSAFIRTFYLPNLKNYFYLFILSFLGLCVFTTSGYSSPLFAIIFEWASLISFIVLVFKLGQAERERGANFLSNRALSAILFSAGLVFFLLSFGPIGNPEKNQASFSVFTFFYNTFPGFNSIRAVGRFGLAALVILVLISSLEINRWSHSTKKFTALVSIIPFLFIIIENWTPHYPLQEMERKPSVFHYLEQHSEPSQAAISIPLTRELKHGSLVKNWGDFAQLNVSAMLLGFESKLKFVNGYSGLRTKIIKDWPRKMDGFIDERSLTALSTVAGLKWVIYNSNANEDFDKETFLRKANLFKDSVEFKLSDDDGFYLFELAHANNLQNPFFVQTPNYDGALAFELLSPKTSKAEDLYVDIFQDINGEEIKIAYAALNADGTWTEAAIPVSSSNNKVKPNKFRFVPRDTKSKVFLRSANFIRKN